MLYRVQWGLFLLLVLLSAIFVFSFPPIPQVPSYHFFADQRSFWGIPRAMDSLSSLLFVPLGIWGLCLIDSKKEKCLWSIFFGMTILTGFGSLYYHLDPSNFRLVFDRLPIAIAFMALLSILIGERTKTAIGMYLAPFLIGLGIFSVVWWIKGETEGAGDMRLYLWSQLITLIAIFYLVLAFPSKGRKELLLAAAFYIFAVVSEFYDGEIFRILGQTISGHTLKHLSAAIAVFFIIKYVQNKK
jgi:hypothetical protein